MRYYVFDVFSRINHACDANLDQYLDKNDVAYCVANRHIAAKEQVFINYLGNMTFKDDQTRRQYLNDTWGFKCHCKKCKKRIHWNIVSKLDGLFLIIFFRELIKYMHIVKILMFSYPPRMSRQIFLATWVRSPSTIKGTNVSKMFILGLNLLFSVTLRFWPSFDPNLEGSPTHDGTTFYAIFVEGVRRVVDPI